MGLIHPFCAVWGARCGELCAPPFLFYLGYRCCGRGGGREDGVRGSAPLSPRCLLCSLLSRRGCLCMDLGQVGHVLLILRCVGIQGHRRAKDDHQSNQASCNHPIHGIAPSASRALDVALISSIIVSPLFSCPVRGAGRPPRRAPSVPVAGCGKRVIFSQNSYSVRAPLRRLHVAQVHARFSGHSLPPLLRGCLWSTWKRPFSGTWQ
jgi:hypothetical protein